MRRNPPKTRNGDLEVATVFTVEVIEDPRERRRCADAEHGPEGADERIDERAAERRAWHRKVSPQQPADDPAHGIPEGEQQVWQQA